MKTFSELQAKLVGVWALLDERMRRLMAANEARVLGRGGISEVSRACGLSRKAIAKGMREIEAGTFDRAGNPGRPGIAAALDLQEHADPGRAVGAAQASDQPYESRPTSSSARLQPARQPQDGRGRRPPRPRCAVPPHQHPSQA